MPNSLGKADTADVERHGSGAFSDDGCAVEVYARLPVGDDARLIHELASPGDSIFDLGAGVGRIADPLAALGHHVVAVDNSADMLAHVSGAEPVLSSIEALRLADTFDVVLLASHLVNTPDADLRHALLRTVAFHLAPHGRAFVEWHPPDWFDGLTPGQTYAGRIGSLETALEVTSAAFDRVSATVRYQADDLTWSQSFTAQRLSHDAVQSEFASVGLVLVGDSGMAPSWIVAQRTERLR